MAVTYDDVQGLLLLGQVGDESDGRVAANAAALWQRHAWRAGIHPDLQGLFAKRDAIEMRLQAHVLEVDMATGAEEQVKLDEVTAHLQAMYANTMAEIVRVLAASRGTRAPKIGAIAATEPVPPPDSVTPDASSMDYSGSPYKPGLSYFRG